MCQVDKGYSLLGSVNYLLDTVQGYLRESHFGACLDQFDLCKCLCSISLLLVDEEITASSGSDIPEQLCLNYKRESSSTQTDQIIKQNSSIVSALIMLSRVLL